MIKVLHVLTGIGGPGGVQSLLLNYYRYINLNKVSFDFLVHDSEMMGFEKNFTKKGAKIYIVEPKRKGIIKNYLRIKKVLRENQYNIVHVHQDFLGYVSLFAAMRLGIKVRIMHTHKANLKESILKKLYRKILTIICAKLSTDFFACGIESAKWTYGDFNYKLGKVKILNNAIESEKYVYNEVKRKKILQEMKLENKFVVGNIARFTYQKNHQLLIRIFSEVVKKKNNAVLMLVGEGELKEETEKLVKKYKLDDKVLFLGNRNDVSDLLQIMDVFVLTSRFEGLPVTLVEAQTSGLRCVIANNITHEIDINENSSYIALNDKIEKWVDAIITKEADKRNSNLLKVKEKGYDIEVEAKKLEEYYIRKCE